MRIAVVVGFAAACGRLDFDAHVDASSDAAADVFAEVALPAGGATNRVARAPDGTLYAVLGGHHMIRSVSSGALWTDCGQINSDLGQIAIDPATANVYVGTDRDVWVSSDQCASWSPTGLDLVVPVVAMVGTRVFAGTEDGVWALTGTSWARVASPEDGDEVSDLEVDPTNGRVFLAGAHGMSRSIDNGLTFTPDNAGLAPDGAVFVSIDPANPQRLIAGALTGASQDIFLSTDAGATWSDLQNGGFGVTFDPADSSFAVFGAYSTGINSSVDGGSTFQPTDLRSATMARSEPLGFTFDASSGVYAATGRGIFYAADHALTWNEVDTGVSGWSVHGIGVAQGDVYLATDAGTLHSNNNGVTWTESSSGITSSAQVWNVVPVPGMPGTIVEATVNSLAVSTNFGATFTEIYTGLVSDRYYLLSLTNAGTKLIVGTGGGVVTSDAPWTTFTNAQLGGAQRSVNAVFALDANGMQILAGSESGLFYSNDGGTTFSDVSSGLSDLDITAIAQLPDGTLLVGTDSAGVFRASMPTGPWIQSGLGGGGVSALLVAQGRVFAGGDNGVSMSTDGETWQSLPGLSTKQPESFAIDSNGELLVGTTGWGLYRTPLP